MILSKKKDLLKMVEKEIPAKVKLSLSLSLSLSPMLAQQREARTSVCIPNRGSLAQTNLMNLHTTPSILLKLLKKWLKMNNCFIIDFNLIFFITCFFLY